MNVNYGFHADCARLDELETLRIFQVWGPGQFGPFGRDSPFASGSLVAMEMTCGSVLGLRCGACVATQKTPGGGFGRGNHQYSKRVVWFSYVVIVRPCRF